MSAYEITRGHLHLLGVIPPNLGYIRSSTRKNKSENRHANFESWWLFLRRYQDYRDANTKFPPIRVRPILIYLRRFFSWVNDLKIRANFKRTTSSKLQFQNKMESCEMSVIKYILFLFNLIFAVS